MEHYRVVRAGHQWKIRVGDRTIGPFDTKEAAESQVTLLRNRAANADAERRRRNRKEG